MFINDIINLFFLNHEEWDYEIILEPEKKPTFGSIYFLLEKELVILKNYLNENLKKKYIRLSTSPAGYFILFVKKKNGTFQ